jgi:CarD family transcriptional regulator
MPMAAPAGQDGIGCPASPLTHWDWLIVSRQKPVERKEEKKVPEKEKLGFAAGDLVVYPTHGVGKILGIEMQEIVGHTLNVFVVHFDKDRMTLRVPVAKAKGSGLRRLSTRKEMDAALAKLKGRSRAKRTMWSRRAQEYEQKINSGDPASIAEVVRDLYRNGDQPEQSYSERQIYQAALDRLVREFAAVEKIDEGTATQRVEQMLSAA